LTGEFTVKYVCDKKFRNDRVYQTMYQNKTAFFRRLPEEKKQPDQQACEDCSTSLWNEVKRRYIDLPRHPADWEIVI